MGERKGKDLNKLPEFCGFFVNNAGFPGQKSQPPPPVGQAGSGGRSRTQKRLLLRPKRKIIISVMWCRMKKQSFHGIRILTFRKRQQTGTVIFHLTGRSLRSRTLPNRASGNNGFITGTGNRRTFFPIPKRSNPQTVVKIRNRKIWKIQNPMPVMFPLTV